MKLTLVVFFNFLGLGVGIFLYDYCDQWKIDERVLLTGKVAVITGATAGIGLETAKDLYRRGATVIIPARNISKAQLVSEEIKGNSNSTSQLIIHQMDLNDLSSVRNCAETIATEYPQIDILINNADVATREFKITKDGFEMHLQINYLSPFLFTMLLLPSLVRAESARLISLSSSFHYIGRINFEDLNSSEESFNLLKAYAQSKLAITIFGQELVRKLRDRNISNIHVYTADPSILKTKLFDDFSFGLVMYIFEPFLKNLHQEAETTIYCATSPQVGNQTGLYYINCNTTAPSLYATNESLAIKLWDKTMKLVNLPPDYLSTILSI